MQTLSSNLLEQKCKLPYVCERHKHCRLEPHITSAARDSTCLNLQHWFIVFNSRAHNYHFIQDQRTRHQIYKTSIRMSRMKRKNKKK